MDLVERARRLAESAHEGQPDKAGEPYIGHPARVAARVHSPEEQAVAWLHDVIEDTEMTAAELGSAGIPPDIVRTVELLSNRPKRPYDEFIRSIRDADDPIALAVKRADLADNADEDRLAKLDPKEAMRLRLKYAEAIALLDGSSQLSG
jgi:(p)ppGpp synthase/HD superfamily hydrolase